MMSRSRNVSRRRRTEPASDTFTAAGCSRRTVTTASTARKPSPSRRLDSRGSGGACASASRIFVSDFGPSPASERSRSCSAAAFSSSRVVTLSSCQMAGGLRPEPRQVHELHDLRRDDRLALGERLHLAELDDLDDLLLDRLADPRQVLRLAVERELRDRAAGLADAPGCAPVGEDAERVLALELAAGRRAARAGRRARRSSAGSSPLAAIIGACVQSSACPPTTSARTSSRCCGRSARCSGRTTACS